METSTDHCSVHERSNEWCPSCIEANRSAEAVPAKDEPKSEPAPKSNDQDDQHHD